MMKLIRKAVALAGAAAMMASCNHMKQIKHMPYPETQRTDVADDYFGTKVADPYRRITCRRFRSATRSAGG